MELKVKVFSQGRNEEHNHYSFEVAALPETSTQEYDEAIAEMVSWCKENFKEARFRQYQWMFTFLSKTDAAAFRIRWC